MKITQGIDIVSVRRIQDLIERQGARVLARLFTDAEREYCEARRMKFEHYAARFAAKEAFIKATDKISPGFAFKDIEIKKYPSGKPYIEVNETLKKKFTLPDQCQIDVSLAHEREFAVATVIFIVP